MNSTAFLEGAVLAHEDPCERNIYVTDNPNRAPIPADSLEIFERDIRWRLRYDLESGQQEIAYRRKAFR